MNKRGLRCLVPQKDGADLQAIERELCGGPDENRPLLFNSEKGRRYYESISGVIRYNDACPRKQPSQKNPTGQLTEPRMASSLRRPRKTCDGSPGCDQRRWKRRHKPPSMADLAPPQRIARRSASQKPLRHGRPRSTAAGGPICGSPIRKPKRSLSSCLRRVSCKTP